MPDKIDALVEREAGYPSATQESVREAVEKFADRLRPVGDNRDLVDKAGRILQWFHTGQIGWSPGKAHSQMTHDADRRLVDLIKGLPPK